jgi:hypothetical protein
VGSSPTQPTTQKINETGGFIDFSPSFAHHRQSSAIGSIVQFLATVSNRDALQQPIQGRTGDEWKELKIEPFTSGAAEQYQFRLSDLGSRL